MRRRDIQVALRNGEIVVWCRRSSGKKRYNRSIAVHLIIFIVIGDETTGNVESTYLVETPNSITRP